MLHRDIRELCYFSSSSASLSVALASFPGRTCSVTGHAVKVRDTAIQKIGKYGSRRQMRYGTQLLLRNHTFTAIIP